MVELERTHGGVTVRDLERAGCGAQSILDLSVSVNPYGPCRAVARAVASCGVDRYPDPTCDAARRALAAALGATPETIALGNGATELLWTLAAVLGPATANAVIAEPAFGEMRAACAALGRPVISVHAARERAYAVDFAALGAAVQRAGAAFVYMCSPGSPTGCEVPIAQVAAFAQRVPECRIVLDESFLSLSDRHADAAVPLPVNVVRVRSLTKDHALPGLRVGYALAAPELIERVERERPAWTVSAPAQAAAAAAVRETAFVARSRERLRRDRTALVAGLRALALSPFPSVAPYLALAIADAAALRERLLAEHAVLVRDCSSFGLPDVIRVAVRPRRERERLLSALRQELAPC